ncbi:CYPRO4-like protein [Tanacetum coccineum]
MEEDQQSQSEEEEDDYEDSKDHVIKSPSSTDDIDAKLKAPKLKFFKSQTPHNSVKLYIHTGGNTAQSKLVLSEKTASFRFVKETQNTQEENNDEEEDLYWFLKVGLRVRALVDQQLQLKGIIDLLCVDFVVNGVYAIKFGSIDEYKGFIEEYEKCLFENTYGFECNDVKKGRLWANPEAADDSMWEDTDESFERSP